MTTEEMLAEALRKVDFMLTDVELAPDDIREARTFINSIHAAIDTALASYDQARAGQQKTGRVKCTCDLKTFGTHAPDCRPQRKPPPDAGSVGQAAGIEALMLAGAESLRAFRKPDPQPAPLVLSKTVLKTLALQGQPAPKCQTCGDTRLFSTPGQMLMNCLLEPCPDCSKPSTGGGT